MCAEKCVFATLRQVLDHNEIDSVVEICASAHVPILERKTSCLDFARQRDKC